MNTRKFVTLATITLTTLVGSFTYSMPTYAQTNYNSQVVLKVGVRGNTVKDLQLQLKKLKYFNTDATGYYGSITKAAVKQFQKDTGLRADGVAGSQTLAALQKTGSEANTAKILQIQLKNLNYFQADPTGYYGPITKAAVKQFQKDMGLSADGIAGPQTMAAIQRAVPKTSRGSGNSLLVPWFGKAEKIFKKGSVATVTDVATGLTYRIKRVTGYNHADCETLTAEDTKILKRIYGGKWSWERRAIIVNVNGVEMAASIAAMPHAGREDQPFAKVVNNRSGGYGRGDNLDGVKNNGMSGVVDVHFYKSKTHASNRIDGKHQNRILQAAKSR